MNKKIFILFTAIVIFSGCKEDTLISSRVSPVNDTAIFKADTLYNCITHTFYSDNTITSTNISGIPVYEAIGIVEDSFFGITSGSSFFQVMPPTTGITFDTSWHFDSAFVYLPYSNYSFGDTIDKNISQSYQAYYLLDSLDYSTDYYPNSDKLTENGLPLSTPQTINLYSLRDSISINGKKHAPALRLKLELNRIMPKIASAIAASSADDDGFSGFINAFKGISIKPTDNRISTKRLPYFRLDGSDIFNRAAIHIYYHIFGTAQTDPLEFYFYQGNCAHFNRITQNYSRYPIAKLYNSTRANDEIVGLQNKPGAGIDLKIYGLNNQIPKNVLLNKVEIQLSLISTLNSSTFTVPNQIFVMGVGNGTYPSGVEKGSEYYIEDRKPLNSLSPYTILDGTSHTLNYDGTVTTTYKLGIPRETMACIRATNDTLHLHLQGSQLFYASNRMLAAGGGYSDSRYKTKLIVVYSSLKN